MASRNQFVQVTPYTTVIVTPELQEEMLRQASRRLWGRMVLGALAAGLCTAAALSFIFLYR